MTADPSTIRPEMLGELFGRVAFPGTPEERDAAEAEITSAVKHLLARLDAATSLIADLTDPDECSFDHHGGCQAHGYLSLQPGETCPQHDAKEWAKTCGGEA